MHGTGLSGCVVVKLDKTIDILKIFEDPDNQTLRKLVRARIAPSLREAWGGPFTFTFTKSSIARPMGSLRYHFT